jgi:hypothetical protein
VWAMSDISVCNAAIMPAGYGIGHPRLFVVDFSEAGMIGISRQKVIHPTSQQLNTKIPRLAATYARVLEEKVISHILIERMGAAHRKSKSRALARRGLNKLDKELGQYMHYAEKKCCKIKSGQIPFSLEAPLWIHWMQVYQSLLKYHAGRIKNQGNLKQVARRCNIRDAMSLSIEEIYLRLKACVDQCDHFRKHSKYHCRKHLYRRLATAKEKEDKVAERQILAIIQCEKDRSFWQCLNFAHGKPQGRACFKVQVEQAGGTVDEINRKEDLHEVIWENIHRKQFYLAKEAPMCSGPLKGVFTFNSVTPTTKAILEGTHHYPPDFNEATKEILQECALICLRIPKNSVLTTINS